MKLVVIVLLLGCFSISAATAANITYINGLYVHKNCEYFSRQLKEKWAEIPEDTQNDFLAKLADCSVDREQLEFAESLFTLLDKKNYSSSILKQAKAKLDLSRSDFKKITDDYETRKPLKATFQYYIYVAQSYYEQEQYDSSLKVLNYVSPKNLTEYQKNVIRYWKAKSYFLKDEFEKTNYFLDLILEESERNWITDASQVLKNALNAKYRPFRAVVYTSASYTDNANKRSVNSTTSNEDNPLSYKADGTYRVNPSLDFYTFKNQNTKKYINLDLNFSWYSQERINSYETYSLKYRSSEKKSARNTFSWDLGFTKTQLKFTDYSDDVFARLGLFHVITNDKFATISYRYSHSTVIPNKSSHTLSLSLFSVYDTHLIYGTVTRLQSFDRAAEYSYDGINTPYTLQGTPFGSYGYTSIDFNYSLDLNDHNTLRAQASYINISYQDENIPSGSEVLTNSTSKRSDDTYSMSLVYTHEYNDDINMELFGTTTRGISRGHQGFLYLGEFYNKNYTANQIGLNLDWTYE